jgi:hypothetical protein
MRCPSIRSDCTRFALGSASAPPIGDQSLRVWGGEPAGACIFTAESPVQNRFLEIKLPFRKAVGAPQPPKHLTPATRAWFASVCEEYELDEHHLRLLALAGESWDRGQQARTELEKHGITYVDRFGAPRKRPEVSIESESRIAFARILREIDLDCAPPPDSRPPSLRSNRKG